MGHPCTTLEEFPEHMQNMLIRADVRYLRSANAECRLLENEEYIIKTYIEEKCPGVKVIFE